MSFRIEHKIKIDNSSLLDFKSWIIEKGAQHLHPERLVNSVYYDNEKYQMYNDSIEGICPRKKIRIRNYPKFNDQEYYLEEKISSIEGRFKTKKKLGDLKNKYPKTIFDKEYGNCSKIVKIEYEREYWSLERVRITLDKNIIIQNMQHMLSKSLNLNKVAVELKTNHNYSFDKLLNDFPFENIRFSKYCEALGQQNFK